MPPPPPRSTTPNPDGVVVAPLPGVVVVRGVIGVIGCVPSFSGMLALLFRIKRGRVGWATSSTAALAGVVEPPASSAAGTTRSAREEVPEVLLVEQTLLLRPRDRMCDWGKLVSSMASFSSLALISES